MKLSLFVALAFLLTACAADREQALRNQGKSDTSAASAASKATPPPKQVTGTLKYSFVDRFDSGSINSDRKVGTPTGRGALVLGVPYGPGKVNALTLLASFQYSYPKVHVERGTVLTFDVAKVLTIGDKVLGFVDVTDAGKRTRVFQKALPAADLNDVPVWFSADVPLTQFEGHDVTITFGASVIPELIGKGGNAGAWVGFANPAIYANPKH